MGVTSMKIYLFRFLSLMLTVVMVLGVMVVAGAASSSDSGAGNSAIILTPEQEDFVRRINLGFEAIVAGNYARATEVFGFGDQSAASFTYGMRFVRQSSLTILGATVDEASVRDGETVMSARVRLYVREDATQGTFGYVGQWPRGIYTMDFYMLLWYDRVFIPEHVIINGERTPGLTAIRLPGQTENSLTVIRSFVYESIPFVYDSPAPFMHELWLILQSFNLSSSYAIFWGFGLET